MGDGQCCSFGHFLHLGPGIRPVFQSNALSPTELMGTNKETGGADVCRPRILMQKEDKRGRGKMHLRTIGFLPFSRQTDAGVQVWSPPFFDPFVLLFFFCMAARAKGHSRQTQQPRNQIRTFFFLSFILFALLFWCNGKWQKQLRVLRRRGRRWGKAQQCNKKESNRFDHFESTTSKIGLLFHIKAHLMVQTNPS